jgi:hypothetical protein
MTKRLTKIAVLLAIVKAVTAAIALVVSRRLSSGDEETDEFRVVVVFFGREFRSRSTALRAASAQATMGGIELDLRDATLASGAASRLDLHATMAGIKVRVPPEWRVDVESEVRGGGVQIETTPADDLPEDAPHLNVHATARLGGISITSRGD